MRDLTPSNRNREERAQAQFQRTIEPDQRKRHSDAEAPQMCDQAQERAAIGTYDNA